MNVLKAVKYVSINRYILFISAVILSIISIQYSQAAPNGSFSAGDITISRLLEAGSEPGDWLTGGRDYQQSYYSPLTGINRKNVERLGFAWSQDVEPNYQYESTPIVVDGIMYTSGFGGMVYALDAETGKQRWKFEPKLPDPASLYTRSCCGPANRGVAVWQGKVYVAALDGQLYALDAGTGRILWKVDTVVDHARAYTSTGAPYIAKNLVVIGNGGAEFDARGYVSAYELDSGKLAWRFFTVPGDPAKGFEHPELEMAAKTWDPHSLWNVGLGGTAWDGMAYDPTLNLLYVGTGNAVPYPRYLRSPAGGDNLFLSSILAINPDTGRLVWHYQTTPGDSWDYTATQKMVLADLKIGGRVRKVLMQAPKNGFFYVLDRATGELLSAKPYLNKLTWASHVDMKTGRPVETEQAHYWKEPKLIFPNENGGHLWHPMAYNKNTGLVYIPVREAPQIYSMIKEEFRYKPAQQNTHATKLQPDVNGDFHLDSLEYAKGWPSIDVFAAGQPDYKPRSFLRAWNPVSQKTVWEIDTTNSTLQQGSVGYPGGTMTTASGLVFQGYVDGSLAILDAKTGKQLKAIKVGNSLAAAPMTYRINGVQYVAIMGGSGLDSIKGRILAFRIDGGAVPPPTFIPKKTNSPAVSARPSGTPEQIAQGGKLFERHCSVCHVGGVAPDLAQMDDQDHEEFMDIVLKGIRSDKGMGSFREILSAEEARSIHAYVSQLATRHSGAAKGKQR